MDDIAYVALAAIVTMFLGLCLLVYAALPPARAPYPRPVEDLPPRLRLLRFEDDADFGDGLEPDDYGA